MANYFPLSIPSVNFKAVSETMGAAVASKQAVSRLMKEYANYAWFLSRSAATVKKNYVNMDAGTKW